jgi:predicted TIM-barrel fold metal-dependent hydrolase
MIDPGRGCEPGTQAALWQIKVVDAHLHCFAGRDDARFPYHADAPYKPAAPATPEHLLKRMDGAGVDHAIMVHPEPYQDSYRAERERARKLIAHLSEADQAKVLGGTAARLFRFA